jgi:hypothetical protein
MSSRRREVPVSEGNEGENNIRGYYCLSGELIGGFHSPATPIKGVGSKVFPTPCPDTGNDQKPRLELTGTYVIAPVNFAESINPKS